MRSRLLMALALALLLASAGSASAQLPVASAATLDRGFDPTAFGGGFAAIASNPAGLARADAPGFSLALPGISGVAGVGPVTLQDFADWEGQLLPAAVKDDWMARVRSSGGQSVRVGAGATPLALSIGPVGFQVSSRVGSRGQLSADAVELLLYGNAGRTGQPGDFDLTDSFLEGFAVSTAALSLGVRATERVLVGVTAKYSIGNGLGIARDGGSFVNGTPVSIDLDFPVLLPYPDGFEFDHGGGIGMDLGVIWDAGPLTAGATLENVFNTFEWDLTGYSYVPGQAVFSQDVRESDFDEVPLESAPQDLRDDFQALADELLPERRLAVGVHLEAYPTLDLFGNVQKSLTDGMSFEPDFYMGVGMEWSLLSFLPLRAHGAVITDGFQLGGGLSLVLGPVHLSGGAAMRSDSTQDSVLGTFTLSFGSH